MTDALLLREQDRQEILRLLARHLPDVTAWAYGSRVNGGAHEGSDLDIVLRSPDLSPIPLEELRAFVQAVRDSNIPILVEARDWARLPDSFQREIMKNYVVLRETVSEWKECNLGDVAGVQHGFAFKAKDFSTECDDGFPVIKIKNVASGKLDMSEVSFYSSSTNGLERYFIKKEDILIAMTGSHVYQPSSMVGKTAKYNLNKVALLNQRVGKIYSKNQEVLTNGFLFYFFKQEDVTYTLALNAGGSANQANISPKQIESINFLLPSLHEQKAIASVLSSLDDKIDLLHRQNKTLEVMAEALFRQWFVEEAGDDWEEKSLYDCIKLIGGGTPKTSVDEYWNGDICWISAKDITPNHKGIICSTEKKITTEGLNNSSTRILPKFSMIISARGTVGKYALLLDDMAFSQSNYGIIPKYKKCYFFTYLLVANVVDDLVSAAYGSVFDTITTKTFKEQYVTIPLEKEIVDFEKEISPLFLKVLNNSEQIRTLEKLRDTLLPKLMSGDVRVAC